MLPDLDMLDTTFFEVFSEKLGVAKITSKQKCRNDKHRGDEEAAVIDSMTHTSTDLQLPCHASDFAVYWHVRKAVLDAWSRRAADAAAAASGIVAAANADANSDSDVLAASENTLAPTIRVPKMVGVGLRSVFEIVRESRLLHPGICTKALTALLDILQGQHPESFLSEPPEIIDLLFELLLELSTSDDVQPSSTESNDGSQLSALACSCLVALIVVRGSTSRLLTAIAALLTRDTGKHRLIRLPRVLAALQRASHAVLLGKLVAPQWVSHGINLSARVDSFPLVLPPGIKAKDKLGHVRSITGDGQYLYIYSSKGLFKIGTGLDGSIKGHIYQSMPDSFHDERGWLGFAYGWLWLKITGKKGCELLRISRDNGFRVMSSVRVDMLRNANFFCDGHQIGFIAPLRDEGFEVRILNPLSRPPAVTTEKTLKLARRCLQIVGGGGNTGEEGRLPPPLSDPDEDMADLAIGKEFMLLRTASGKVLYSGKSSSLGLKSSSGSSVRWTELPLAKSPRIAHMACGHEGGHAILLTDDGVTYFVGTARRGEDGEPMKPRRQPKAGKPRKFNKVEGERIVWAAANNGTSALVTHDGRLLLYGKEAAHCACGSAAAGLAAAASSAGQSQLPELAAHHVTCVALGKAHAAVVTASGLLLTFGINNKGQCGREFPSSSSPFSSKELSTLVDAVAMDTGVREEHGGSFVGGSGGSGGTVTDDDADEAAAAVAVAMCPRGAHQWRHDVCMVCTVCHECTGYSTVCLTSLRGNRNPGQECGCGDGDSGCAVCGCCRLCAGENCDNVPLQDAVHFDIVMGLGGGGEQQQQQQQNQDQFRLGRYQSLKVDFRRRLRKSLLNAQKVSLRVLPPSAAAAAAAAAVGGRLQLQGQQQPRPPLAQRFADMDVVRLLAASSSSIGGRIDNAPDPANPAGFLQASAPIMYSSLFPSVPAGDEAVAAGNSSNAATAAPIGAVETARVTSLRPAVVALPHAVTQVACGLHHTVVLTNTGDVFTFGSNAYGQLGLGDLLSRAVPAHVAIPAAGTAVAAGSNHTVVLTVHGDVYTFGSYAKGQLGRKGGGSGMWHTYPGMVPGVGRGAGRRATWIAAVADVTCIRLDESLVTGRGLERATLTANQSSICDSTVGFSSLIINRIDGSCHSFSGPKQMRFQQKSVCVDPLYNFLWSCDGETLECYNVVASDLPRSMKTDLLQPWLSVPSVSIGGSVCLVRRSQMALHLLATLDTLAHAHTHMDPHRIDELIATEHPHHEAFSREQLPRTADVQDFSVVNRFESHGGGWGYSTHSIEAIRFMADTDILLGGFGLFGGRGEYTAKIKVFDLGTDGGEHESDGDLLAETDDVLYDCGPRQKYAVMFFKPVPLLALRWYVAWARVTGPSSDCGANGQAFVTTEDQVTFHFKSSKQSNNGTDLNAGQIPQLLYRVIVPETKASHRTSADTQNDDDHPVYVLSDKFALNVTKECFQALLLLLKWSWLNLMKTLKTDVEDPSNVDLDMMGYVARASLRLLHLYTFRACSLGQGRFMECMAKERSQLREILSSNIDCTNAGKKSTAVVAQVLEECHNTFVLIFHALYSTPILKWNCLCQLLFKVSSEKPLSPSPSPSLSPSSSSSSSPSSAIEQQAVLPAYDRLLSAVLASLCAASVRLRTTLPVLSEAVRSPAADTHTSVTSSGLWTWREVLERLLDLITLPVKRELTGKCPRVSRPLIANACQLLARLVAELSSQITGADEELQVSCGRVLHTTPSRFLRTNHSRTWNTGNGSPDAICFSVDSPGVVLAGAAIYAGLGNYDYELELLDDTSNENEGNGGAGAGGVARWTRVETAKGSFGPDDVLGDVVEVRFARPVPLREGAQYALVLRNHGGRTANGDGGLHQIQGPDCVTFTFSTCSLSFNGTTQTRGQIPQLLYYSNPQECDDVVAGNGGGSANCSLGVAEQYARRTTLALTAAVLNRSCGVFADARESQRPLTEVTHILSQSCLVTTLLPLVLAHVAPLAAGDPRSAVHVLNLVQELLPHVAALNAAVDDPQQYALQSTVTPYCAVVESDHPYKSATVTHSKLTFPNVIKWITIEFAQESGTAQNEDSLQIYISSKDKNNPLHPAICRLRGNSAWPHQAILLPGNEVTFSLETASEYVREESSRTFGFRCMVSGHEIPRDDHMSLPRLELELVYAAATCAAALASKYKPLPSATESEDEHYPLMEVAEAVAAEHSHLLAAGLALEQIPTVTQALDGVVPLSCHSNERLFLRDLVHVTAGSRGGRLARWLQPQPFADPSRCNVIFTASPEDMRCGWPMVLTVIIRDQYGDIVHVPNLKVDVKAAPIEKTPVANSSSMSSFAEAWKSRRFENGDCFEPGPPPSDVSYEETVKDKYCYRSITMMKQFENYSFEELRYYSASAAHRTSESMLVRPSDDGTFSVTWTPSCVGWYSILVTIDDYALDEIHKVEVKEPPQGIVPPNMLYNSAEVAQTLQARRSPPAASSGSQPQLQPRANRVRKFAARDSAGLRVRAHPSLQSEQLGVVPVNGIISFVDELHNDDGVWLRLDRESVRQYCSNIASVAHSQIIAVEAWCLQFNQHIGKTLLIPVEEPRSILDQVINETVSRNQTNDSNCSNARVDGTSANLCEGVYTVVKCGASGHNVRSLPSMAAPRIGMMVLGNQIHVSDTIVNEEGTWLKLRSDLVHKFCFGGHSGEAWSLATSPNQDVLYLRKHDDVELQPPTIFVKRGEMDKEISHTHQTNRTCSPKRGYEFAGPQQEPTFYFVPTSGTTQQQPFVFAAKEQRPGPGERLSKWVRTDPDSKISSSGGPLKKDGNSAGNGNGDTPPDTPPRRASSRSSSPRPSSSPVHVPDSAVSAGGSQRRGSTQSDTSALVSSLTRDLSQSPSPCSSPHQLRSENSPLDHPAGKAVVTQTQTGTQTSPDTSPSTAVHPRGTFNVGQHHGDTGSSNSNSVTANRLPSPKLSRKDRAMARTKHRNSSPVSAVQKPAVAAVKEAISPSQAEAQRAVFAAFLWQEGVVHDAMACASFLKFHPGLPRDASRVTVVTRRVVVPHDADPAGDGLADATSASANILRQRHSVEVTTSGNNLQIKPSTLENLKRSAANANRARRKPTPSIQEECPKSDIKLEQNNTILVSTLPPALHSLVILWDGLIEITNKANCASVNTGTTLEKLVMSPTKKPLGTKKKKECGDKSISGAYKGLNNHHQQQQQQPLPRETVCELCGGSFPYPVTYHMRHMHPGCGQHAQGKGYNSLGEFCVGWAGHCGDGGIGGSSWYLVCDYCRDQYIRGNKNKKSATRQAIPKQKQVVHQDLNNVPTVSTIVKTTAPHIVIRDNALFLLELNSSANFGSKQSDESVTIVAEAFEENEPFGKVMPFQSLPFLGAHAQERYTQQMLQRGAPVHCDERTNGNLTQPTGNDDEDGDNKEAKGLRFHRSVSMGMPIWSRQNSGDGNRSSAFGGVSSRRRNNSTCDAIQESSSSLVCHPSTRLQRLAASTSQLATQSSVAFMLRWQPLVAVRYALRHALRRATCRAFAFRALRWLLHTTTQPAALHDLLWFIYASFNASSNDPNKRIVSVDNDGGNGSGGVEQEHPLSDIGYAGDAGTPLWRAFHHLLQSVADLMAVLPPSSPLLTMAVRCWYIKFAPHDHLFLHRSHVFSYINRILSRSDDDYEQGSPQSSPLHQLEELEEAYVETFKDLTNDVEIRVSSRQAMVAALTDNSTETFWESGDEDRNKTKTITILCPPNNPPPKFIYVHIDNTRDIANKVVNIAFWCGVSPDELTRARVTDIDLRASGWFQFPILNDGLVLRLDLKGPDNSLRVRQIRLFGEGQRTSVPAAFHSHQNICEAETLKVFRLITQQVFGKLVVGDEGNAMPQAQVQMLGSGIGDSGEHTDLKEHVVGILFSRCKLSQLQRQVCQHIVHAIRAETMRLRDEWDALLCSPDGTEGFGSDAYAFEMLSLVLALSGSAVGRAFVAAQEDLLTDMLVLLHAGSPRVQRQVIALLRRVLPHVEPVAFARIARVPVANIPPVHLTIATFTAANASNASNKFDMSTPGLLDVLLSVVAKALTVQLKIKGTGDSKTPSTITVATAIHPRDPSVTQSRIWLRGCISRKLAEDVVLLLNDMTQGVLGDKWASVTKSCVAEAVLNLTRIHEPLRIPAECMKLPTLWLALAALGVLHPDHSQQLSSGQWQTQPPRPLCNNHDDGETLAMVQCNICGCLCADCDRYLHLHRRTRVHSRQVCKEEEDAIRVDLHEGCGRTKLFWLLALTDSSTLKTMVEFRLGHNNTLLIPAQTATPTSTASVAGNFGCSSVCRFCSSSPPMPNQICCQDPECQEHAANACTKVLECGHGVCGGVRGETDCLPCLVSGCSGAATANLKQDADDMCMICFTDALSAAPALRLVSCGHVFHAHCTRNALTRKWPGPRISFSFAHCPICKVAINHPLLNDLLEPIRELWDDVRRKALMRLEYEGLSRIDAISSPGGRFFNDALAYAIDRYAYYVCFKCNKAYYGGEARCDADAMAVAAVTTVATEQPAVEAASFDASELVCGACSDVARAQMCAKHGTDFLEYKCRYCCSVAVFFCFGTTHFCNPCHDDFQRVANIPHDELPHCPAGPKARQLEGDECPLHVIHPPTGEEFALGCGVCRNAHTF